MSWTGVSAVAGIVSSAAIVVTLIYLAVQTNQNTAALQAGTRQAMLDADQSLLTVIGDNPTLPSLFCKRDLTDEDAALLHSWLTSLVRIRENNYLRFRSGSIDERTWVSYRGSLVQNLSGPKSMP